MSITAEWVFRLSRAGAVCFGVCGVSLHPIVIQMDEQEHTAAEFTIAEGQRPINGLPATLWYWRTMSFPLYWSGCDFYTMDYNLSPYRKPVLKKTSSGFCSAILNFKRVLGSVVEGCWPFCFCLFNVFSHTWFNKHSLYLEAIAQIYK